MNNKIKYKVLSLTMVFFMLFTVMPKMVFAETDVYGIYMNDNKTYESDSSGNKVSSKIYGKISDGADLNRETVTKVFIHKDVTEIKDYSFNYWVKLNEVSFQNPTAIVKIGVSVFYKSGLSIIPLETLTSLDELGSHTLGDTKLTSVTVPASVTKMTGSFSPFDQCTKLKQINIASGNSHFKSIDGVLFTADGKKMLTYPMAKPYVEEYSIPNGVETLSASAFPTTRMPQEPPHHTILYYPSNIGIIKIPASVNTIETNNFDVSAMSALPNLKRIEVDAGNSKYKDIDGVLFTKDGKELLVYPSYGRENSFYSVPNDIEKIRAQAFTTNGEGDLNYQTLREVEFPANLKEIDIASFQHSDFSSGNISAFVLNSIIPPKISAGATNTLHSFGTKTDGIPRAFYVPDDSLETYKTDENWDLYASEIKSHSDMFDEFTFAVNPSSKTVQKGSTNKFETTLDGCAYQGEVSKATWSVENANSSNTKIADNGLLTVGLDETSTSLTVKAVSKVDNTKSAVATVTVSGVVKETYKVTATAGKNGNISPNGVVNVNKGDDKTYTFTPDSGYKIGTVTVNGTTKIITGNTYTINNITENITINVEFIKEEVPSLPSVEGSNQKITVATNKDVKFKINENFINFVRLEYKGNIVDSKNYKVENGSIIITLKGDYVKTLEVGTHTFTAVVGNDHIPFDLIVEDKDSIETDNPKTGDNIVLYMISALICLVTIFIIRKKQLN